VADVETNVQVIPQITLTSPPPNNSGSEAIAAALLKASENQAAATASLISALAPVREAEMPTSQKKKRADTTKLMLFALIAFLLWK
jgi:hypothetical protein